MSQSSQSELTAFGFFKTVFKDAPLRVVAVITLTVLAAGFEGIGFVLFLPLLEAYMAGGGSSLGSLPGANIFQGVFQQFGISPSVPSLLVLIVTAFAAKNTFLFFQKWFTDNVAVNFELNLKKKILNSTLSSDWKFYLDEKVGTLLNAIDPQASYAATAFRTLMQLVSEVFNVLIYCLIGLWMSWKMFVVSLSIGLLCFGSLKNIIQITKKSSRKIVVMQNESQSRVLEDFTAVKFIKGNHLEEERKKSAFSFFERLRNSTLNRYKYLDLMETLPDFMMACVTCAILYFAHAFLKAPSEIVLLLIMVLYRMNRRMLVLQMTRQKFVTNFPSFEHCRNLILRADALKEKTGSMVFQNLEKNICLENVSFSYAREPVLTSVSLEIFKNQLTALVGRSGSGKTTITDLIVGLLRPSQGSVMIDGISLNKYDIFSWRNKIAYVPQDAFLASGTIEENIRLGNPGASPEDVRRVAKTAHADEFIERQSQGYATVVGDRGIKLSGGQRQRVVLARALLRNPQLLILDEATSALDNESEEMVRLAIKNLKGRITLLIVAHRFSTIINADMIYVLDGGRIVESGPRDALMARTGLFNQFYSKEKIGP